MTAKEFEGTLRTLLSRRPFLPFTVEYLDGDRFLVDAPFVAFSGGSAGFIGPDASPICFFDHKNVKRFAPLIEASE